ncbi:MAG: FAD-binding oxidoreductase, partial [Planctomycetota bacterium]
MADRKPSRNGSGWTRFWIGRSRRTAQHRRDRYGLEPPRPVARLLREDARVGFLASLRLAIFAVFGSPRQMAGLYWRYLTDQDTPKRRARITELADELRPLLSPGSRVLVHYFERRLYSRDLARVPRLLEKVLHRTTPQLVVQPREEEDVAALMRFAVRHRLPVFPRGVSSSAFGGAVPTLNGVTLDLSSMRRILEIDVERRTARVQAGVRWADLAERLRVHGLAPFSTPSSRFSTVGGWAAAGGLGIESYGFGHFSEAVQKARIVVPSAEILQIDRNDPALQDFIGTEGQFGVFSELTLRVRERPLVSRPRLLGFDDVGAAFTFLDRLASSPVRPSHVAYYDAGRLEEENLFFADRTGRDEEIVPRQDSILLHFDDAEQEKRFLETVHGDGKDDPRRVAAAHYLWSERYFPMKFQRLGPGMLAAEVMLSRARVPAFIRRARRIAARFGNALAVEVFVCRPREGPLGGKDRDCVVIASFRCDPLARLDYFIRLLLVQLLVHLGVRLGGRPYGFGIWNSPFLHRGVPRAVRRELVARKVRLDPGLLLNPMKFFHVRTRLFNLPGILFLSPVYGFTLGAIRLASPAVGLVAKLLGSSPPASWAVPPVEEDGGLRLLRETALRCVFCGACVSCCPAYALTGDERSTGRGKLRLSEILSRGPIAPEDRGAPFRCLRCKLCEEVCQAALPLTDCYEALEARIERDYGRPVETMADFASLVDTRREWIRETYGVSLPPWTAEGCTHPVAAGGG